jgi:hypothetical protein
MSFLKYLGNPRYYHNELLKKVTECAEQVTHRDNKFCTKEFSRLANGREKIVRCSMVLFTAPVVLGAGTKAIEEYNRGNLVRAAGWGGVSYLSAAFTLLQLKEIESDKQDYLYSSDLQSWNMTLWGSSGVYWAGQAYQAFKTEQYSRSFLLGAGSLMSFGMAAFNYSLLPYSIKKQA